MHTHRYLSPCKHAYPGSILGYDSFENPNFTVTHISEATPGKSNILSYYFGFQN